jgi:UDP-N-acetylmuramoyl-tripeptide--D-alanyl-D-alanine ligase
MKLPFDQIAAAIGAGAPRAGVWISGWSVDSRTCSAGDLFFALRGPNHDGHRFVAGALGRGAAGAVVEYAVEGSGNLLVVPDTQAALEGAACWARGRFGGHVVAVTGSAGKTTTKEIIARLLGAHLRAGKTEGNLNNHVGLPLSILRLPEDAEAAVLEIGMNHPGEIRRLASIARPDIGVVTNVGFAHAEFFGSIDEVAAAKRELIESLPAGGVAVLNYDDERVRGFAAAHPGRSVTFGLSPEADIHPDQFELGAGGVRFRLAGADFESCLAGRHNLSNILAGIAVAGVFGIAPGSLADAVRELAPEKMRGERFTHDGITVFNDCYNSNPEAACSMVDVLRATPARRRIAVLGEMLELGQWSEPLHREVGRSIARCGIDVLVGIRGAARQMVDEAVRSGLSAVAAFFFEEPAAAGVLARSLAREQDAVLFKGSRGTHVEEALDAFLRTGPQPVAEV